MFDYITSPGDMNLVDSPSAMAAMKSEELLEKKRKMDMKTRNVFRVLGGKEQADIKSVYSGIIGARVNTRDSQIIQTGIIDSYANKRSAGRRLLVASDPYNILVAFQPTIHFIGRVDDTIGSRSNFKVFLGL